MMIKLLILSVFIFQLQPQTVNLTFVNNASEAQHLHIGDFRNIVIPPDGESTMRLSIGDEVYALMRPKTKDGDTKNELFLFTISDEHSDAEIDLYKWIKKAKKAQD